MDSGRAFADHLVTKQIRAQVNTAHLDGQRTPGLDERWVMNDDANHWGDRSFAVVSKLASAGRALTSHWNVITETFCLWWLEKSIKKNWKVYLFMVKNVYYQNLIKFKINFESLVFQQHIYLEQQLFKKYNKMSFYFHKYISK